MECRPASPRPFATVMVEWYRLHGDKDLPWRATSDPWAVLVAALLLRKTTVRQVVGVYGDFLRRWPSPRELAGAAVEEVEEVLRPLGMEKVRARLFKRLAEELLSKYGGEVPLSLDELKELPGVGDYAAREVLVAVAGAAEPLLDRNAARVLERVFGVRSRRQRPHTDPALWEFAKRLVPPESPREYNFGLLDFARKICTARSPRCEICPLASCCRYYAGRGAPSAPSVFKANRS
ncbi:MAG: A/G-specific adenine glycosylase [Thermoproteus sp.]